MVRSTRRAAVLSLIGMVALAGCSGSGEVEDTVPRASSPASTRVAPEAGSRISPTAPASSAIEVGRSVREIAVEGETRRYLAYRPDLLESPASLILVFHGHGGSPHGTERATGWNAWADDLGAVVVYPEGIRVSFNAGGCCGIAHEMQVDDVAAALAIIDDVASHIAIDADRVYSTGFSNGASMSYRLACETDRFAAIGPVGGVQFVPCNPLSTTSVMHIHGLADTTMPAAGETRADGTVVRPLDDVIADWRRVLGCEPATESKVDGVRRSTASCVDGRSVDLITLDTFGHEWPTAADGVDATAELARFFAEHRR